MSLHGRSVRYVAVVHHAMDLPAVEKRQVRVEKVADQLLHGT